MASSLVRELLDAGIHFGHRCSRWNPKMKPFIYGKRSGIHIIDIRETLRGLLRAKKFLTRVVADGDDVLFVGTKRQAREIVQEQAERCKMHYVSERWLGGTLTNFRTIRARLQRLEELEALVQSPQWETDYSKKMKSTLSRELKKIRRNLDGIRRMNRLPGALVVVDMRKEYNAIREAKALGIPTVCLLDTDGDPEEVTIAIPGNDDSMRSIAVIMKELADAVEEGLKGRPEPSQTEESGEEGEAAGPARRRLSRRQAGGRPGAAVSRRPAAETAPEQDTTGTETQADSAAAQPEPAEVPAASPAGPDAQATGESGAETPASQD